MRNERQPSKRIEWNGPREKWGKKWRCVNKTKERLNNDEITLNNGFHGKSLFLRADLFSVYSFFSVSLRR